MNGVIDAQGPIDGRELVGRQRQVVEWDESQRERERDVSVVGSPFEAAFTHRSRRDVGRDAEDGSAGRDVASDGEARSRTAVGRDD